MLLEESLLFHVMFSGSMIRNWSRMDLPGVDLLGAVPYHTMGGWQGDVVAVPEDFSCKLASSISHLTGKQGTFTESFALAEGAFPSPGTWDRRLANFRWRHSYEYLLDSE